MNETIKQALQLGAATKTFLENAVTYNFYHSGSGGSSSGGGETSQPSTPGQTGQAQTGQQSQTGQQAQTGQQEKPKNVVTQGTKKQDKKSPQEKDREERKVYVKDYFRRYRRKPSLGDYKAKFGTYTWLIHYII